MALTTTFVLIGKLKGKTMDVGPVGNQRRFINGECEVPVEESGLVATALRFYCAFPKGNAETYHKLTCEKLGIDPDTLEPLSGVPPKIQSTGTVEAPPDPVEKPTREEIDAAVEDALLKLDNDNDDHWTKKDGFASLGALREHLPEAMHTMISREIVDRFGIRRQVNETEEDD